MKKKSRITRIGKELDDIRRRLRKKGVAYDLTEVDRIIAKEVEKEFFKEKSKEKDLFDDIFGD